jgi:hypothetical protein
VGQPGIVAQAILLLMSGRRLLPGGDRNRAETVDRAK